MILNFLVMNLIQKLNVFQHFMYDIFIIIIIKILQKHIKVSSSVASRTDIDYRRIKKDKDFVESDSDVESIKSDTSNVTASSVTSRRSGASGTSHTSEASGVSTFIGNKGKHIISVVFVYRYKDSIEKIWLKPTLFIFDCLLLYKKN